jgi:hypothetical protein
MKNFIPLLIVCFCMLTVVTSCKKSGIAPHKPTDSTTTTTTGTPGTTDVYVAGYEVNSSGSTAVYWKNGTEVKLQSGLSTKCLAKAVFVSGNDVYVAGASGSQAVYWKNGVLVGLPSELDTLQATSICVANGNVYVSISQQVIYEAQRTHPAEYVVINSAGVQTGHGLGNDPQTVLSGIAVSGTDVYASGNISNIGGTDFGVQYFLPQANYWKNANPVTLPFSSYMNNIALTTSAIINSSASAIAVSGNNVYTAGGVGMANKDDNEGNIDNYPAYWVNSTPYMLGEQTVANNIQTFPLGSASSICVSGSDVYVGGTVYQSTNYAACYWKNNGATVFMSRQGDYTEGNALTVSGSDVYMAGTDFKDSPQETYVACYWKNGSETTLATTEGSFSNGYGIFVVKH